MRLAGSLPHVYMPRSMAAEPWNRVNIPLPSAVSSVRVHFTSTTGTHVQTLLGANEKVLQLIHSEILQTEVRVLYELLYILNNSYRGNKTFKGLQQVEQCINRLKNMKLDAALQDLTDLCPSKIHRELSIKSGECDVPSQPRLEWICLKVLGAAQLMSCALSRCSRAFVLTKQQMKWEEFIVLNMVITSMLSRFWVMFRGLLVSLSTLYQRLLELIRDVADAQPMPFLTDFSLPADLVQFLAPFDAFLLTKHPQYDHHTKDHKEKQQQQKKKKSSVKVRDQGQTGRINNDLGVAVERDLGRDTDLKPFIKIFKNFTKGNSFPEDAHKTEMKLKFKKQVSEAPTFTNLAAHLEEMILWCRSQRMEKERRLLTFLQLKCRKMKCLEAAGYNVQRKLRTFRQAACWASSPQKSVPKSLRSPAAMRRNARLRSRLKSLRRRIMSSALRTGGKKKRLIGQERKTWSSASELFMDDQQNRTTHEETHQTTESDSHDDIDDIFASVGF